MTNKNHSYHLEDLCKPKNLKRIDIIPDLLRAVFKEPQWYDNNLCLYSAPDLLINYYNNKWDCVELKCGYGMGAKAIHQIEQGIELLCEVVGVERDLINGKFVTYSKKDGYKYKLTHKNGKKIV
jgi:hypothetical protein